MRRNELALLGCAFRCSSALACTAGSRTERISVDFPEPEMPVMTESRPTGKRTSTFFRLFACAPRISIHCSTSPNERRDFRIG